MNPFSLSVKELEQKARAIRRRIIVLNAESPAGGHTGADLSQVELLTALYFRILNCSPALKRATSAIFIFSRRGTLSAVTTACWPKQALSPLTGWQPINTPTRICLDIR
jgi:transketolase N-terminal domain/subunit